jgi:ribonuclease J
VISRSDFSVRALGGLGEIGMNSLVVETEGRLLVIDFGVMFTSNDSGIDLIYPSFEYLRKRRDDIEAVILTHAHEDHLSGLPFLLRELDPPVYAGSYAIELLKVKSSEPGSAIAPMTRCLLPEEQVTLGPFSIKTFPIPHSIVQNTGLVVDMPRGRILHTGDFKLGMNGDDRGAAALGALGRAGEGRVDLMLSDSTGAEEAEIAGQEAEVYATFDEVFGRTSSRIFVAIFSSNIRRLESVFRLASLHGRHVGLAGRSVQNHVRIAENTGELVIPSGLLLPLDRLAEMPRDKVVIIVSGTQGEFRSALSRLAHGNHHQLTVEQGDAVLLSSRFIPGNEIVIGTMIDRLLVRGARVYHRVNTPNIHVSGHGGRQEISAAISNVKPRCFLPVHGTFRHLNAGAALATAAGVKHVAVASNGQVVHCSKSGLDVENDGLSTGRVYVDQGGHIPGAALRDRRILGTSGVLAVSFALDDLGRMTTAVDVKIRGVLAEEAEAWLGKLVADKVRTVVAKSVQHEGLDTCREMIRHAVRKLVQKQISRDPLVLVSILSSDIED